VPRLLLVRHAESTWNVEGRWQGGADPELSPEGERQARLAGEGLGAAGLIFEEFVSSDLERARRTAALLAGDDLSGRVTVEPGLREYDVGEWSGLTRQEISVRWPDQLQRWAEGTLRAAPGGESREAFRRRVREALGRLASSRGESDTLVVTHGGVLRSLASWLGRPGEIFGYLSGFWTDCTESGIFLTSRVDLLASADYSPNN
jgi:probable phosphoglycerate mutase